ncbi:FecR domain-containing protein [Algoriphagus sp.]|uniref:FecR family protein n=1 Tax=Algoriphagus sp. TaxID=1872435 RepID=UPI0032989135
MNLPPSDYTDFSLDDFITDPYFKEWVLHPDTASEDFWSEWQKLNPSKITLLMEAKSMVFYLEQSRIEMTSEDMRAVWGAIQQDINAAKHLHKSASKKTFPWSLIGSAASVILLAMAWMWYQLPDEITYQTTYGETKEILLPDSSMVILNSNSQISFIDNWEDQMAREIVIEGEAFFHVVHKVDHQPFKVLSSQNVEIEVLGTEFNVYNRAQETEVVLSSGLVTLSFPVKEKEGKIVMSPGELVEFKESRFHRKKVDPVHYTSWKDKVLYLDETSLEEIIKMARNNYGITVEIANEELLDQTASGSMPIGDAENFIDQISKIFNLEITNEENKYLIKY